MASDRLRALHAFDNTKAGVKGLVDARVSDVPRIFHHHPDALALFTVSTHVPIPIIDFSRRRSEVVAAVKVAAETVGLFQVVNHGVPEAAMRDMLAAVRRFHEEPVVSKAPYYTRDAARRVRCNCNTDLFQAPAARWRDTLYLDDPDKVAAEEPLPPACSSIVPRYTQLMRQLGRNLFELLSEALGVRRGHLEEEAGCMEAITMFAHYYPACPQPDLTLGAGKHSDPSFATVLLQDQVGGLQVLVEEGASAAWVDVPTVPGALVVNVGDFLKLVSNGRFHSVLHSVVAKDVGPRISVACFFRAKGVTVCAPVLVDGTGSGSQAQCRTVTAEELLGSSRAQNGLANLRL
ncbi:1-aminocyclopropane-1-carboxylate oxidase homolog 1-like [Triticum dicoccoides]|uniref:1-aminocyclopropane-1-carboxylate oxidase homolog 1-like n=1 Tax=Triticum dicoccoides TaxID=85692 RepID=UPI00188FAF2E|nr:1-aminocyclopropane-1-carboxylate oxidase homolog 1-like [Triticum dicoccoides]